MKHILEVDNIQKYYGTKKNITKALKGISFNIDKGEFVGIMGASGSGKTTLLNCISTIDTPTSGNISIEGIDITNMKSKQISKFRREKLGFIFQDFNLLNTLTAYENISLSLTLNRTKYEILDKKIRDISEILGISEVLDKFPYEISGGQKQRVAAARAIISNPSLILADEPTGSLDSKSSKALLESLKTLNQKEEATILMVTHDALAASYCSRVIFMKDGKLFNEVRRGEDSIKEFYQNIVDITSLLGGDIDVN
ncbi:MAG: ABC transporter ATP-binding protein [Peptostreptococcaceae bacterium]